MMNICQQCGGAIMTPGLSYGYAGPVCMCSWRTPVTPMPQAQIDEALVLAMEADKREIERLRADLSASQAREKVRVEALRVIAARPNHEPNRSNWEAIVWESIEFAEEALALPADDTALHEMLARAREEMQERCAKVCDEVAAQYAVYRDHWSLRDACKRNADAIRALEVKS